MCSLLVLCVVESTINESSVVSRNPSLNPPTIVHSQPFKCVYGHQLLHRQGRCWWWWPWYMGKWWWNGKAVKLSGKHTLPTTAAFLLRVTTRGRGFTEKQNHFNRSDDERELSTENTHRYCLWWNNWHSEELSFCLLYVGNILACPRPRHHEKK